MTVIENIKPVRNSISKAVPKLKSSFIVRLIVFARGYDDCVARAKCFRKLLMRTLFAYASVCFLYKLNSSCLLVYSL